MPSRSTLFPYTTLFRSTLSAAVPRNGSFNPATGVFTFTPDSTQAGFAQLVVSARDAQGRVTSKGLAIRVLNNGALPEITYLEDRKSTRLNSSHGYISYAVEIYTLSLHDALPIYPVGGSPEERELQPGDGRLHLHARQHAGRLRTARRVGARRSGARDLQGPRDPRAQQRSVA